MKQEILLCDNCEKQMEKPAIYTYSQETPSGGIIRRGHINAYLKKRDSDGDYQSMRHDLALGEFCSYECFRIGVDMWMKRIKESLI